MAARTVTAPHSAWHGVLTADEEDVVTFDRDVDRVEIVVDPSATQPVFYSMLGRAVTVPPANTPSSLGVAFPGSSVVETAPGGGNAVVRLMSTASAKYHVMDASGR